jgi:hypothetical protein
VRAVVYDGARARRVEVPAWVILDPSLVVRCERCRLDARLEHLTRAEAERALGRFALWHARCREPGPIRVFERRPEESYLPAPMTFVRRRI